MIKGRNVVSGQKTECGILTFYTTKETESFIWRNVTCKNCLRKKTTKEKSRYFLREKWVLHILGIESIEKYDENSTPWNICKDLKQVKKRIKDWIETWKENAEENEYKFKGFKTDYKTYCTLKIKTDTGTDTFYLKDVKEGKNES